MVKFSNSSYDYAEVRIENGESLRVSARDETNIAAGLFYGVSARVLKNGSWGFSSSNDKKRRIDELLEEAERLAGLASGNVKVRKRESKDGNERKGSRKRIIDERAAEKPEWIDDNEIIRNISEAKKEANGSSIVSSNINFSASKCRREFYNSEGKEIIEDENHFYFSCSVIARAGGITQVGVETSANRFRADKIDMLETANIARKRAEMLLRAEPAPKGRFAVVLDPEMAGTFIHEVVGHASEADAITTGESIFTKQLGKRVGNELVNISDDPTLPYFGGYKYDDEGVAGKRIDMIKNGILVGFMNSRETAEELGHELNGHARAEDYSKQPIVRMSNTIFSPGKHSKEDIFDIRDGVYVKGSLGGSVDIFSGGFMFKAREGHLIKNGEIAGPLRDVVITGNITEVLNGIEAVGKDFETHPGICGKHGQGVPVEDGGPHIRVSSMKIG